MPVKQMEILMWARIHFHGPLQYRLRSSAVLCRSVFEASTHRALRGPSRPGWTWFLELATACLRDHVAAAFKIPHVQETRRVLDSVVVDSPASAVTISPVSHGTVRGSWFIDPRLQANQTLLYFHGGGYSFYPKSYAHYIGLITCATKCKTLALDYRLSPEYRFPAQLDDALGAYRWLLETGVNPASLIVGGDSAGGNLTLAFLLAARDARLPLPVFAFTLSPATGLDREPPATIPNGSVDWITAEMLEQWADWFCDPSKRSNPLVSPVHAALHGLPPIYIQAGRAEILYESIQAFADRAAAQRANVVLETWDDMPHDFQMFGPDAPQSAEALRRLGEVIDAQIRGRPSLQVVSVLGS